MIAGPGHPDLERSQTDSRSTRIRHAFELSQRGLITAAASPIAGLGLGAKRRVRGPHLNPDCAGRTSPPNEYNGRLSNEINARPAGSQALDLSTIVPGGTPSTVLADLGADGSWTTERHSALDLRKRVVAEAHAAHMRERCPRNADLIKVENPTGSEDSSRSGPHRRPRVAVNRAKRSLALDITLPASRDVLLRLAAGIDVLLANFLGAKAAALGVDEPTARARWTDNRQRYLACALRNRSQPVVNSVW